MAKAIIVPRPINGRVPSKVDDHRPRAPLLLALLLSPSISITIEENKGILQCAPAPHVLLVQDHLTAHGKPGHSSADGFIPGLLTPVFVKLEVRSDGDSKSKLYY